MALDSTLAQWKSAGTYRVEVDQSVVVNEQVNVGNLRLFAGFSKQGPINTPILITNEKQFTNLFGTIDRSLEKKGSYFHRLVLEGLSAGPCLVLNLLKLDPDTDQVQSQTFSVNSNDANKAIISVPLVGCYSTDKFWEAEASAYGNTIDTWLGSINDETYGGYENEVLHFVNVGKKAISIIVKKSSAYNTQNYNLTLNDWYGAGNVPEYLNSTSIVSDYMVDVFVIEGNFGPTLTKGAGIPTIDTDDDGNVENVYPYTVNEMSGYDRFKSDISYQDYIDENGLKKDKLNDFLRLPSVKTIASYTGSLIPNFVDKLGNNIWIQKLIDDDTNVTGLLCYENVDELENVDTDEQGNINEKIDLIGANLDYKQKVNVLSYKFDLSDEDSDQWNDIVNAVTVLTDADISLNPNEILLSKDDTSLKIGDYLVSRLKSGEGASVQYGKMTKVYDIKTVINPDTKVQYKKIVCYDYITTQTTDGDLVAFKFTPIDEYATHLQIVGLGGFKLEPIHMPGTPVVDGVQLTVNEQQNRILDMLRSKDDYKYQGSVSNLYNALSDRDFISWRYLVDTFGNGLEESEKDVYTKLCANRASALAIINCPSQEDFKKSKTPGPAFTNTSGGVEAEYIAKGGNPAKASEYRFTLPDEKSGASYGAYFYPYIKIMDQSAVKTVPPAALVSNLFLAKYNTGHPWTIVAGQKRGVISGNQTVGVEATLIHDNRDWLEPVGINSIIWQNGVGIEIYCNKTAKQTPKSALSSTHVRETAIYIEDYVENILRKYNWTENTAQNRMEIKTLVDNFLDRCVNDGGIYDYRTVMDTSNNTSDVIDSNQGVIDIYIEPVKGLEILTQRLTILRTGVIKSGQVS